MSFSWSVSLKFPPNYKCFPYSKAAKISMYIILDNFRSKQMHIITSWWCSLFSWPHCLQCIDLHLHYIIIPQQDSSIYFNIQFACSSNRPLQKPWIGIWRTFLFQIKNRVENREKASFPKFEAVCYKTQLVAGTNYFIKVSWESSDIMKWSRVPSKIGALLLGLGGRCHMLLWQNFKMSLITLLSNLTLHTQCQKVKEENQKNCCNFLLICWALNFLSLWDTVG